MPHHQRKYLHDDPSGSASDTEHSTAKSYIKTKNSVIDLIDIVAGDRSALNRQLASVSIVDKAGQIGVLSKSDQYKFLDSYRNALVSERNEHVYYGLMRLGVLVNSSISDDFKYILRDVAEQDGEELKREYSIHALLERRPDGSNGSKPAWLDGFLQEHLRNDPSEYVRYRISHFISKAIHPTRNDLDAATVSLATKVEFALGTDKNNTISSQNTGGQSSVKTTRDGLYSTTQATSKDIKAQMLIAWVLGLAGLLIIIAAPDARVIGILMIVAGAGWNILLRWRKWWDHG